MKVLHVIPNYIPAYRYGGPVKVVHELCRALKEKGVEVKVFTTNVDGDKNLDVPLGSPQVIDGVETIYYPVKFFRFYCYSKELSESLKKNIVHFDIVHIHSVFLYPTYAAARWCRIFRVPYIINPFGALDAENIRLKGYIKKVIYIKLVERHNIKDAAIIHAASLFEKEKILSLGFTAPVIIVPRGIYVQDYAKNNDLKDLKNAYPELRGKKTVLFLGRITFKKGFELLADAFKRVLKERKDTYLIIAGPSEKDYIEKVKNIFKKMNLMNYVIFTGMLLGEEKLSAFYSSDIFILPSYGENFGLAVLEAMACKLPVIITNRVGLCPDVKEYKAGIVTSCDPSQIADAVLTLLDNEGLRKTMGENGRRLVEDRFIWDKVADRMLRVYNDILIN